MTFGALATWQAWLLIGAAGAVAARLFLLKLRPPRMVVPSLLLWRRVLDDARELTWWERIRRAVSLLIAVLIALALAFAAARPARGASGEAAAEGRLLVVLDASFSMNARTRSGETRWRRAVAEARRLVGGAGGREVAVATTADGLVEGPTVDTALLETALDRMFPWAAESAAAGAWPRLAGAAEVHFITDGASPRPIPEHVIVHSVFEPAPNVAVTALELRSSLSAGHAADAYLEIANFAPSSQTVRVTLSRGPSAVFDREIDVAASEALRQVIPLARGGEPLLRARVAAPLNALDADDEAVAWIHRASPLAVTVVGESTAWLRTAFERNPDVRATFVRPADYRAPQREARQEDALIFDRWAPPERPQRPAILFAPPPATPWLAATAAEASSSVPPEERKPRWELPGTHPVVQGVDPLTLVLERVRGYGSPTLVPVARSARGTPLVYVSESPSARLVLVAFSEHDSNLASAPGFPVLMGNTLEWLSRPAVIVPAGLTAGTEASGLQYRPRGGSHEPGLLAFDGAVVKVTGPGGGPVPITAVGPTTVATLREPGLYIVEGAGAQEGIAVNLGDAQISNLTRTTPAAASRGRSVAAGGAAGPWWVYCAAAAFLLVIAEWWTWQRRITV